MVRRQNPRVTKSYSFHAARYFGRLVDKLGGPDGARAKSEYKAAQDKVQGIEKVMKAADDFMRKKYGR